MQTISYKEARKHLAKIMARVCKDHIGIIITRSNAEPVVMLSLSDFQAMDETNYLLNSPVNAVRLAESVSEIEAIIN